jgi:hypothetical protein
LIVLVGIGLLVAADGNLKLFWKPNSYRVSVSPAIVPDRNFLYVDHYWDGNDWLVVLELATGKELAAVELSTTLPTIGTVFPGMKNDVYLLSTEAGTQNGLISRVYVP